jgi:energy-converting hydrogenase Eha subunit H
MVPAVALQVTAELVSPAVFGINGMLWLVSTVAVTGAIITACATPCPLRVTVCGLPDALSAMVSVALSADAVEGLK